MNPKFLRPARAAIILATTFSMAASALGQAADLSGELPAAISNRPPLAATLFLELPLGCVRPRGWLLKQCQLQRDGLTGNAEALYADDFGTNSGWLGGTGENWERGPYYLKGLIALAYTLDDPALKSKAQKWVDWLLEHQGADGYIGPAANDDWWPRMLATYALKDYFAATGDPRVPGFLDRYFHYMLANLPQRPLKDWGKARAGDEMDVALWLYNRNGDTNLLSLVRLLREQAYDWPGIFSSNNFVLYGPDFQPKHNVNVEQALKFPAVYEQLSRQPADASALNLGWANLMREDSLSCGINSGTEFLSGNASVQGVELCAIVESMLSLETATRLTADATLADRLETIAFNALPAALANHIKGIQYYTLPNNVIAINGGHGFNQDYPNGTVPGPNSGYPCCRSNFHMGWPKFVQNSWAVTADGGLALIAYSPTMVRAMAGGQPVEITEDTDYPFDEQVRLRISTPAQAAFPLLVRIPAWCANAAVMINDRKQSGVRPGSFFRLDGVWNNGDVVTVDLPMTIRTVAGPSRSVAVQRGPLVYSLRIGEHWSVRTPDALGLGFDEFAVHPTTPWNYALQLDPDHPAASFLVTNFPAPADPFDPAQPSVALIAQGRQLPEWTIGWRGTHAFEPPVSPVTSAVPLETITLVPFGSQHLRVSWFPWLGAPCPVTGRFGEHFAPDWCSRWTTFGGNWLARDGALHTVPASANGAKALAMATAFTNFTYEADVSVGLAGNAGLIFRVSRPDIGSDAYCGYYAGISAANSSLEFGYASNSWHRISAKPFSFTANKTYHLTVQAQGQHFRISIDHAGEALVDATDGHFAGGMLGVRDYCTEENNSLSSFANLEAHAMGNESK